MLTKLRNDSASRTLRFYNTRIQSGIVESGNGSSSRREWSEGRYNCGLITSHMTRAVKFSLVAAL